MTIKTVELSLPTISAVLNLASGPVELEFDFVKQNELTKLQIDLEKLADKSEEEQKKIAEDYDNLPFKKLLNIKGELVDFGKSITIEQLKAGECSTRLYIAVKELFWKYIKALNPTSDVDAKKENAASV